MGSKPYEEPEKLYTAVPHGTTEKDGDGLPPGFQVMPEGFDKRQQKTYSNGRKCWWVGCGTVLTQYDEGELGKRAKKAIKSAYPEQHVVLCFMHQRHMNIGILELEREEKIQFARENLCNPAL